MTTEQAYIEGFVKRASEYGFSRNEAIELLKSAGPVAAPHVNDLGAALATKGSGGGPTYSGGIETMPLKTRQALRLPAAPATMNPQQMAASQNDLGRFTR